MRTGVLRLHSRLRGRRWGSGKTLPPCAKQRLVELPRSIKGKARENPLYRPAERDCRTHRARGPAKRLRYPGQAADAVRRLNRAEGKGFEPRFDPDVAARKRC